MLQISVVTKQNFFYYECGCLKLPISAVTKQDFLLSMQLMSIALKVCSNQAAFLMYVHHLLVSRTVGWCCFFLCLLLCHCHLLQLFFRFCYLLLELCFFVFFLAWMIPMLPQPSPCPFEWNVLSN